MMSIMHVYKVSRDMVPKLSIDAIYWMYGLGGQHITSV